jgi:hypothetical protein
VLFVEQIW